MASKLLLAATILLIGTLAYLLGREAWYQPFHQQFTWMAESLWKGRIDLTLTQLKDGILDTVQYQGKYYWPQGPFPAFLLTPLIPLASTFLGNTNNLQGIISILLGVITFYLIYSIAKKKLFSTTDALLLASLFVFGTSFAYIVSKPQSWFFSQTIAVVLIWTILYQWYVGKQRYWLIGILYAALLLTRVTAAFTIVFFIATIALSNTKLQKKILHLTTLLVPVIIAYLLSLYYNYIMTGTLFHNAYSDALVGPEIQVYLLKNYGLFSYENILPNIYWYFLAPLITVFDYNSTHLKAPYFQVNPFGTSLFILTPLLLRIATHYKNWWSQENRILGLSTLPTLIALLLYYASGFWTVGPRYLLDILPFWFILLFSSFPGSKLNKPSILAILFSCILVTFLVYSAVLAYKIDITHFY